MNVELLSRSGDLISSVVTSQGGSYLFKNIIPGLSVKLFLIWKCLNNVSTRNPNQYHSPWLRSHPFWEYRIIVLMTSHFE